ncbi:MAG: hypothetical protein AAGU14_01035 [Eubacteriaceae bacterium]
MNYWIPIIILLMLCLVGYIRLSYLKKDNDKNKTFISLFLSNLREFCNELIEGKCNEEKFEWLQLNSEKVQIQLGDYGRIKYKPSYSNIEYDNYLIIINGIYNIREWFYKLKYDFDGILKAEKRIIENPLLIYIGVINNYNEEIIKSLKNPVIWFREGIRAIVILPIYLVFWFGIIRYSTYKNANNNNITRFISFILTIIYLISSVITITGYNPFIK